MSELSRLRGSEGYGSCDDASAVWLASAISVVVGIVAAKCMEKMGRENGFRPHFFFDGPKKKPRRP